MEWLIVNLLTSVDACLIMWKIYEDKTINRGVH